MHKQGRVLQFEEHGNSREEEGESSKGSCKGRKWRKGQRLEVRDKRRVAQVAEVRTSRMSNLDLGNWLERDSEAFNNFCSGSEEHFVSKDSVKSRRYGSI